MTPQPQPQPQDVTSLPRSSRIRTIPYDENAVDQISDLLACSAERAEFQLPGSIVWQMTVPGTQGRPVAMITLWPGIKRVDVIAGPATIVFTDIQLVDLVPGVEVQFRRTAKECLIVAIGGKVIVRA